MRLVVDDPSNSFLLLSIYVYFQRVLVLVLVLGLGLGRHLFSFYTAGLRKKTNKKAHCSVFCFGTRSSFLKDEKPKIPTIYFLGLGVTRLGPTNVLSTRLTSGVDTC